MCGQLVFALGLRGCGDLQLEVSGAGSRAGWRLCGVRPRLGHAAAPLVTASIASLALIFDKTNAGSSQTYIRASDILSIEHHGCLAPHPIGFRFRPICITPSFVSESDAPRIL